MAQSKKVFIGLPTYYGAESIIGAVKSIVASVGANKARVVVCVDGNPLKPKIEKALIQAGAEVVLSKERGGQIARINQLIEMSKGYELLILTQDDIGWDKDCFSRVVAAFDGDEDLTLVGLHETPAPAETRFEKAVEIGSLSGIEIGKRWRGGDNYLLASGRGIAVRRRFIEDWRLPEEMINSDSLMYFVNKQKGGTFRFLEDAIVYNPSPQTLAEHHKQRRKFTISQQENEHYLGLDLADEYAVPVRLQIQALLMSLVRKPIYTLWYVLIFGYVNLFGRDMFADVTRFWDTDISTKRGVMG